MKSNANIGVGDKIRTFLESAGMQQQNVADRLGISQSAVSAYYRGKPFGKNAAQKWSKAFGFRVNWLLTGEGSMLKEDQPEIPAEEKPTSKSLLIEYLERRVAELEGKVERLTEEKTDLLQQNAVLKYENMMLAPRKGDAEDAASSLSAGAI